MIFRYGLAREFDTGFMKKVFIILSAIALASLQFGCAGSRTTNESNQANAIANAVTETNQSNGNTKIEETPIPTYTNADEALADGKKLLDELETEKAIEVLFQAVKLNPDLAEAHFNLGIAYALIEKAEEQRATTQVETTPTPKVVKKGKKEIVERTKNSEKAFENAVKAYKKILAANAKDDAALYNLGRAYNKLNEDEDAMKALKEAVKLKPDDVEYQIEYGAILIKLAQYAEAVAALKKALSIEAENLQAEDLLEKAEAGRKRVEFGNKPKPPQQQTEQIKPRDGAKIDANTKPKIESGTPTAPPKNANK